MIINDSNFTGNYDTDSSEGGGVFFLEPDYSDIHLVINNSHFQENYATKDGGVFFFDQYDGSNYITVNDSTFVKNYAGDSGGVGYMSDGSYGAYDHLILNNSIFRENNATYGGVVRIDDDGSDAKYYLKIFESTLVGNRAEIGGAIYADVNDDSDSRTVIDIYNSKIINNEANTSGGGGIYLSKQTAVDGIKGAQAFVSIGNSIIAGNIARDGNGSNCLNDFNTSRDPFFMSVGGNIFEDFEACHGSTTLETHIGNGYNYETDIAYNFVMNVENYSLLYNENYSVEPKVLTMLAIDKSLASSGYSSNDLENIEIYSVTPNKWNMVSIKNGYSVNGATMKNNVQSTVNNVYSFDGTSWSKQPTTITPKMGLWISPGATSDTVWMSGTSDTTNDILSKPEQLAYYKSLAVDTWHFVSTKVPLKWSDLRRANITPDSCTGGYTKAFYYNSPDDSWNSVDTIPSLDAIWLKHFCN